MPETVLQELNRRFPFTKGLEGQALASAVAVNWSIMDPIDVFGMFRRMAMYVAAHDGGK